MFDVTVRINLDGVRRKLNDIEKGLGDRAIVSSLNKAAAQAKTRMSEAIRSEYNISASLVRERLRIRRAQRGKLLTFTATLIGNPETGGGKRSMNLIHFLEKRGVEKAFKRGSNLRLDQLRFQVKRAGGRRVIRGAFIGNKGRTMFVREGRGRLPIKAVRTIGVPQMFTARRNLESVVRWLEENMPRIANAEIAHFLRSVR